MAAPSILPPWQQSYETTSYRQEDQRLSSSRNILTDGNDPAQCDSPDALLRLANTSQLMGSSEAPAWFHQNCRVRLSGVCTGCSTIEDLDELDDLLRSWRTKQGVERFDKSVPRRGIDEAPGYEVTRRQIEFTRMPSLPAKFASALDRGDWWEIHRMFHEHLNVADVREYNDQKLARILCKEPVTEQDAIWLMLTWRGAFRNMNPRVVLWPGYQTFQVGLMAIFDKMLVKEGDITWISVDEFEELMIENVTRKTNWIRENSQSWSGNSRYGRKAKYSETPKNWSWSFPSSTGNADHQLGVVPAESVAEDASLKLDEQLSEPDTPTELEMVAEKRPAPDSASSRKERTPLPNGVPRVFSLVVMHKRRRETAVAGSVQGQEEETKEVAKSDERPAKRQRTLMAPRCEAPKQENTLATVKNNRRTKTYPGFDPNIPLAAQERPDNQLKRPGPLVSDDEALYKKWVMAGYASDANGILIAYDKKTVSGWNKAAEIEEERNGEIVEDKCKACRRSKLMHCVVYKDAAKSAACSNCSRTKEGCSHLKREGKGVLAK